MIKEILQSAIDAEKKKKKKSEPKEKTLPEPSKPKEISEKQMKGMHIEEPYDPSLFQGKEYSKEIEPEKRPEGMDKPMELNRRSKLGDRIAEIRLGKAGKKRILEELEKQKEDYNKKNNRP
jgi:hypothetical protein